MDQTNELPDRPDVRLVVADMDGTLLDGEGRVPEGLWPLLERLSARGIAFVPASGRQYATLRDTFARAATGMTFIAENGAVVVRDGRLLSSSPLDDEGGASVVRTVRELASGGEDVGLVRAGAMTAWVERTDEHFLGAARPYYHSITPVPDLLALDEPAVKIAVHDFSEVEDSVAPALAFLSGSHQVVVSGEHWVDVMAPGVDKGTALRWLQTDLGVSRAQTVVFGDYPNDLGMLAEAELSFAMANAHPDVLAAARYRAPANTEQGVLTVLEALLG